MEKSDAIIIIRSMMLGIDPETGQDLPEGSFIRQPQIREALALAKQALEVREPYHTRLQKKQQKERKKLEKEAGAKKDASDYTPPRPWTEQEEAELTASFLSGADIPTLMEQHQRSELAVMTRLGRLGLIDFKYGRDVEKKKVAGQV